MATKKETAEQSYRVVRDCPLGAAGDVIRLTDEDAALLLRDGMIRADIEEA